MNPRHGLTSTPRNVPASGSVTGDEQSEQESFIALRFLQAGCGRKGARLEHVSVATSDTTEGDGDLRPDQGARILGSRKQVLRYLALRLQPFGAAHALRASAAKARPRKCGGVCLDHRPEREDCRCPHLRVAEL